MPILITEPETINVPSPIVTFELIMASCETIFSNLKFLGFVDEKKKKGRDNNKSKEKIL